MRSSTRKAAWPAFRSNSTARWCLMLTKSDPFICNAVVVAVGKQWNNVKLSLPKLLFHLTQIVSLQRRDERNANNKRARFYSTNVFGHKSIFTTTCQPRHRALYTELYLNPNFFQTSAEKSSFVVTDDKTKSETFIKTNFLIATPYLPSKFYRPFLIVLDP